MSLVTQGLPSRRRTRVMRPWDWSVPPRGLAYREILTVEPDEPTGRPPLLMVHGVAHGAWCFAEKWLPAAATRGFRSSAVSLRGHGGSGGAAQLGRATSRDYVHDILQAITEMPEPPILIGHSMGGLLSQLVAERYPLRGLVLLAPAPANGAFGTLMHTLRVRPADALAVMVGRTLPMRPDVLFTSLDPVEAELLASRTGRESAIAQYELLRRRRIGPVRCPVLVIGTHDDQIVRPVDVERTAQMYDVEPVWLDGMGHDVMLDADWQRALDTVLDWVDVNIPPGTPPLGPIERG
ncbi:MAG: alpha/beta hydrolase [Actinomycetes bacterium]